MVANTAAGAMVYRRLTVAMSYLLEISGNADQSAIARSKRLSPRQRNRQPALGRNYLEAHDFRHGVRSYRWCLATVALNLDQCAVRYRALREF